MRVRRVLCQSGTGKRRRDSRGQVAVIFALVFMVLIAFSGLAIDTDFAYLTQWEEQTAADASSLDASTLLNGSTTPNPKAFAMAQQIAQTNGYRTNPAPCSRTTAGGQTTFVFVDTGCGGLSPTRIEVKVP